VPARVRHETFLALPIAQFSSQTTLSPALVVICFAIYFYRKRQNAVFGNSFKRLPNKHSRKRLIGVFFKQMQRHGDNFSYIIADESIGEAAVVDSSYNADEIIRTLKSKNLTLKYIINTHGHGDHTAGNTELQSIFGAKIAAHKLSAANMDIAVDDGDTLNVGKIVIKAIYTPGHTADSISLLVNNKKLLTGDTLFVGECGRTDLPGGNSKNMYSSLFDKLLKLDDSVEVYPGHDYGPKPYSTIGEEKKLNYTLQPRSLKEFIDFMKQP
jgi:glyoxylase-like metal-dependent hydrolase (beta-lactamase superfamily II)